VLVSFVQHAIMGNERRTALRPLRWEDDASSATGLAGAMSLPAGTVSFLLTDIEGSTQKWQLAPDSMAAAVARHYEILDAAISTHGGVRPEEQGEGDSIVAAFSRASDALSAALDAQRALQREPWPAPTPIAVRMAIHTGEARFRDEANYVGMAIIRTARLRSLARGGQVLVSSASRDLALDQLGDQIALRDLGDHRLKDLARPERVYQLVHPELLGDFAPLRSLDATPNNLPVRLSTFIGRVDELSIIENLLATQRMVTITGSGGAGKTRLALQTAAEQVDRFGDGVWWIELAPLADPGDVAIEVASLLDVQLERDKPPSHSIAQRLGNDATLLVFDNCEHLVEPVAELIAAVLQRCPNIVVLATSRGLLDLPGEITWRVPPLALPAPGVVVPIERLGQFDAVRLFLDRARRARPGFGLNDDNGPTIAEICQRLDGIPLAIELAAARAKSLAPARILAGLDDALRLLTGGPRLSLPRQQTLEASIAWSVDLLGDRERSVLFRTSVFSGSFDLGAAEAICAGVDVDELEVLDVLDRLIDHSLVTPLDHDQEGRFLLLETVRQFADRHLKTLGESLTLGTRHADHFADLVRGIAPRAQSAEQDEVIARLTPEVDNIRSALVHKQEHAEPHDFAAMVRDVAPFWDQAFMIDDAILWMTRALEALPVRPSPLRGQLLAHRAEARFAAGDLGCITDAESAIEIGEAVRDPISIGRGRWTMAALWSYLDLATFVTASEQAVVALTAANDQYALADAMVWRCMALGFRGRMLEAQVAFEAARPFVMSLGNPHVQRMFWYLEGEIALWSCDVQRAAALADRAADLVPGANFASSINLRLRADDLLGVASPLLGELEARADLCRRSNDWLAADLFENALLRHLLRADPDAARRLADRTVENNTGLLAVNDALKYGYHALAALGAGRYDAAWISAATAEEQSARADSVAMLPLCSAVKALVLASRAEYLSAVAVACEGLRSSIEFGMRIFALLGLEVLAFVAEGSGDHVEAARMHGAALAECDRAGIFQTFAPFDRLCAEAMQRARIALGEAAYGEACAAGARLSMDEAVAYALRARGERRRPSTGWDSLTPTELQVVDLVRSGRTNREVAEQLLMGAETVKTHLSHVFIKLGVSNRTQLTAVATERSTNPSR
jgi:predicted ATPase/class 3 adenylate cyclase/DNA-binding CsgD family transcriptional regulator